jgi:hypothetical protein
VLNTRVEARDWLSVGQHNRQLQLCVPVVVTTGESYRMRDARRTDTTNQTSPKGT